MTPTLLVIGTLWTLLSNEPNAVYMGSYGGDYTKLYDICEEKAGRACCRASVQAMESINTRPIQLIEGCPEGQKAYSLRCPASLNWCAPLGYQPPMTAKQRKTAAVAVWASHK